MKVKHITLLTVAALVALLFVGGAVAAGTVTTDNLEQATTDNGEIPGIAAGTVTAGEQEIYSTVTAVPADASIASVTCENPKHKTPSAITEDTVTATTVAAGTVTADEQEIVNTVTAAPADASIASNMR